MNARWSFFGIFLVAVFLGLQVVVLGGCTVHNPEKITL